MMQARTIRSLLSSRLPVVARLRCIHRWWVIEFCLRVFCLLGCFSFRFFSVSSELFPIISKAGFRVVEVCKARVPTGVEGMPTKMEFYDVRKMDYPVEGIPVRDRGPTVSVTDPQALVKCVSSEDARVATRVSVTRRGV